MTQDDLTPWQDTPLVQALTTAGTPAELSGEDGAMAAFRASAPSRRRRHVVRFLGTGMTSVALVGVVGTGVAAATAAAAYTRSLPEPVQSMVHDVLGPIGVPAPHPQHKSKQHLLTTPNQVALPESVSTAAPPATTQSTPTPSATPSPAVKGKQSPTVIIPGAVSPSPSVSGLPSPTPTASVTPTPTPTPTGPAGDPSTWTISATGSRLEVRVHHGVQVSGTLLDADGNPVVDSPVVVRVHLSGAAGWQREAVRRTDSSGSIQAYLDDLTENTVVVLGAGHHVHSTPLRIVVRPVLTVSAAPATDGTSYLVTVSADGGQPGDAVSIVKKTPDGWVVVGQATLDDNATASFSIPAPKHKRGFVVQLPATKAHAISSDRFVLEPLG